MLTLNCSIGRSPAISEQVYDTELPDDDPVKTIKTIFVHYVKQLICVCRKGMRKFGGHILWLATKAEFTQLLHGR